MAVGSFVPFGLFVLFCICIEIGFGAFPDPTGSAGDINGPVLTSFIERVSNQEMTDSTGGKWQTYLYRNKNYSCGYTGYQTFLFAARKWSGTITPIATKLPLMIYFHGGTGGYFRNGSYEWDCNNDGGHGGISGSYDPEYAHCDNNYHPDNTGCSSVEDTRCSGITETVLDEEDKELFQERFFDHRRGFVDKLLNVYDDSSGSKEFRILLVSDCVADWYSGIGEDDPNNPYNPNGNSPKLNGLLSTRAALKYIYDDSQIGINHMFAYGTSSGTHGVFSLLLSFAEDGYSINGGIADSGIPSPYQGSLANEWSSNDLLPKIDDFDIRPHPMVREKLRNLHDPDNVRMPHLYADDTSLWRTPIVTLYNANDNGRGLTVTVKPDFAATPEYTNKGMTILYKKFCDELSTLKAPAPTPPPSAIENSKCIERCVEAETPSPSPSCSPSLYPTTYPLSCCTAHSFTIANNNPIIDLYTNKDIGNSLVNSWISARLGETACCNH
eukprot:115819_1